MTKPMTNTPLDLDRVPKKIDSKFRYVLLASHRAEQLMQGARPKIETPAPKTTRTAMEEVLQDTVVWDYGPAPEPEIPETSADEMLAADAAEDGDAVEGAPAVPAEPETTPTA